MSDDLLPRLLVSPLLRRRYTTVGGWGHRTTRYRRWARFQDGRDACEMVRIDGRCWTGNGAGTRQSASSTCLGTLVLRDPTASGDSAVRILSPPPVSTSTPKDTENASCSLTRSGHDPRTVPPDPLVPCPAASVAVVSRTDAPFFFLGAVSVLRCPRLLRPPASGGASCE